MIQIEDGIPAPFYSGTRGPPEVYPWAQLEVGQSFFVPGAKSRPLSATCCKAGKRHGRTFCARPATKDGVEGVRVWRVQ